MHAGERSDQLPGRLQQLNTKKDCHAGPVNCIRLFGLFHFTSKRAASPLFLSARVARGP